jgi:hypothetical protein
MGASDIRLEAVQKAAKVLGYAKATGDPIHHAETVHAEISRRADSILAEHPNGTMSQAQKDAICELLASAIMMAAVAGLPKERWFGRAWKDFCAQSPFQQMASVLTITAIVGMVSAVASGTFYYTPTVVKWAAHKVIDNTGSVAADTSKPEAQQGETAQKPAQASK